ncbi:SPOR domain-containing protein [Pseudoalteromonas fenneropenaei]|uniref:SPOR domain-containing protein n=1 Tax=Pseudoalteromonas fenneropenaei TaxID=1737459 RepID=A0ABV7CNA1_9GAMM
MAQHDYINRQPSKTKHKQPAKKPFPGMLVAVAVSLVGAFGYGLWYVKQHADPAEVKLAQNPTPKTAPVVAEPKQALPRTPDFITEMKEHEVKVEVKEIEKGGPYVMQCGSFRTYEQAETLKAKIAFAGLISEIRRVEGKNGVWYKVRLGPYESKRQAESDKNKLKRVKIVSCGIWGWT